MCHPHVEAVTYVPPYPSNPSNSVVHMELSVKEGRSLVPGGTRTLGSIEMELFDDTVPITARNFRELCRGGLNAPSSGLPLHFKGAPLHRIIPRFMIQGGDITRGDGSGGLSIFGTRFKDESFAGKAGKHKGPGILSMANSGKNTNGSQFFICTVPCPWLDGHHVVFGQVIKGYDTVAKIESYGSPNGKPSANIIVSTCGVKQEKGK